MGRFELRAPFAALGLAALLAVASSGCNPPPAYPQQPLAPGQLPPGQFPAGGIRPVQMLPIGPPQPNDPISLVDFAWLRGLSSSVLNELIAALPPESQARVQGIPFQNDGSRAEVNAYAACESGQPLMAVTDGLLQMEAYISQFRATDEVFGTRKLDEYLTMVAQNQKPGQPLVTPPQGFVDPTQDADSRKVARQHQLMEEQLAFVLGHELAHHHLGHTGCANGPRAQRGSPADIGRLLSRVLPPVNQLNEVSADTAGTQNLLNAGARRQGYKWNEEGAMLTLDFFARMDKVTPTAAIFAFANTHPHPSFREPIIRQAANNWRQGTGVYIPPQPPQQQQPYPGQPYPQQPYPAQQPYPQQPYPQQPYPQQPQQPYPQQPYPQQP